MTVKYRTRLTVLLAQDMAPAAEHAAGACSVSPYVRLAAQHPDLFASSAPRQAARSFSAGLLSRATRS